jgi:hypothetical protein
MKNSLRKFEFKKKVGQGLESRAVKKSLADYSANFILQTG